MMDNRKVDVFLAQELMGWRVIVSKPPPESGESLAWSDGVSTLRDFHNWSPTTDDDDAQEVFEALVEECEESVLLGYDKCYGADCRSGWTVSVDGQTIVELHANRREAICYAAYIFVAQLEAGDV